MIITSQITIGANGRIIRTNVFMILPGHKTYVDPSGCPWAVFQWFFPCRKVDFLFGTN